MNHLIFRRQFVMLSKAMQTPEYFKVTKLAKFNRDIFVYAHDDLEITTAKDDHAEIVLLGYILDPFNPAFSNKEILDHLLTLGSFKDITEGTNSLGGRYALIYNTNDTINVFHDATGFREVYYCDDECEIACGSTPNILRNCLTLEKNDEKAVNEFYASPELDRTERCWIGTKTILKGVTKLLPNHYVDMVAKKQLRYWPVKDRKSMSLQEVVRIFSDVLKGTYKAAFMRNYKIYHSLTAGWDSRVLLAHAKDHMQQLNFYFYRGFRGKVSADYTISKQISDDLGLNARFIDFDDIVVDEKFEKIYFNNNILARPKLLKAYYDSYVNKLENTVTISGTMGNEIIRILSSINRNSDDPVEIAKLLKYDKVPYVIESLREWLKESRFLKDQNHVLVDLFCWEQFFGNWGALSSSEQDIVREEIRPLNNRLLLSSVLCLKDKYRYRDYPLIYEYAIKSQWPELMKYEIDIRDNRIKKVFRVFGVERAIDVVFHNLKEIRSRLRRSGQIHVETAG